MKQFFIYGNTVDVCDLFKRFMSIPEVRHLIHMGTDNFKSARLQTTIDLLMKNMSAYLKEVLKTKGARNTIDQQAYRTVMASISGSNLRTNRLIEEVSSLLVRVSWCCFPDVCTNLFLIDLRGFTHVMSAAVSLTERRWRSLRTPAL